MICAKGLSASLCQALPGGRAATTDGSTPAQTPAPAQDNQAITPEYMAGLGYARATYDAGAKTSAVYSKPDRLARGDKVVAQVISGERVAGQPSGDAEVQNMPRAA